MARCNQQVLESIQVHIEKDWTPGPVGRFDTGELRDFGVGAVTAVPEQCVPRILRTAVRFTARQGRHFSFGQLHLPMDVFPAQHVSNKKLIVPVAVEIGEVHPHGEQAGLAQRQSRHAPEMAATVVEPDAIFGLKIVADVNIRSAVFVQVTEYDRKAPIIGWCFDRPAFLIQKVSVRPAHRDKLPMTVVVIEHVGFTVLQNAGNRVHRKSSSQIRSGHRAAVHCQQFILVVRG